MMLAISDMAHCVLLMMSPEDSRSLPSHSEAPATEACVLMATSSQSLFAPAVVSAAKLQLYPSHDAFQMNPHQEH